MITRRVRRIIQVPVEDELLHRIDKTARAEAKTRAAFVREACKLHLSALETRTLDERYEESYRKKPEDPAWTTTTARLLAHVLPNEEW